MIATIKRWLAARRIRKTAERFTAGYDWAMGMLIDGQNDPTGCLWPDCPNDPFDAGAIAASRDYFNTQEVVWPV